eukprot:scaffold19979_cov57-Cyclotella_meneghiniana.AAC.1
MGCAFARVTLENVVRIFKWTTIEDAVGVVVGVFYELIQDPRAKQGSDLLQFQQLWCDLEEREGVWAILTIGYYSSTDVDGRTGVD